MATTPVSGLTVVPAYRVVAHFVKLAKDLPEEEGLEFLQGHVRQYVRNSLSVLHGGYADIGERWALSHLGDPSIPVLGRALRESDQAEPRKVVEDALHRCAALLPRPDLSARFLLLPGDGESKQLVETMGGVTGVSLASQVTLLFFWPTTNWLSWLAYTTVHEYDHLVRNHLLPRGVSGGRSIYLKTQEPDTLLDAMIAEGIADSLARQVFPHMRPPWLDALAIGQESHIWPRVRRRLAVSDPTEIRRYLYGDGDRVPLWTGYCLGYQIVESYLKHHLEARPSSLTGLSASLIFAGSGYDGSG